MLLGIIFCTFLALGQFGRSSATWCGSYWVSREEWGGDVLPIGGDENGKIQKVFFHHTSTPECSTRSACSARLRSMQQHHLNIGFDDLGYNFVIGGDGSVYVVRGFDHQGTHTKGHNANSISISFVGNFERKTPSNIMLDAARQVINCGLENGNIKSDYGLYGHRDGSCTLSPGTYFHRLRTLPRCVGRPQNLETRLVRSTVAPCSEYADRSINTCIHFGKTFSNSLTILAKTKYKRIFKLVLSIKKKFKTIQ